MSGNSKGAIKSKKAKLAQKNQQKMQKQNTKDTQQQQNILYKKFEPRKLLKQEQKSDTPIVLNRFNFQKLKKVEYPQHVLNVDAEIAVVEEIGEKPLNHADSRALITYKVQGALSTKYVSDTYLNERVDKMIEPKKFQQKKQAINVDEDDAQDNKSQKSQKSNKSAKPQQRKKNPRYFDDFQQQQDQIRAIKCFRCGKKGHIAKNCLQMQVKQKCMYCLGDHSHHDCTARACFRCNQLGHVAQECRATGLQCRKCNKTGHVQKNCGAIVFLDYNRVKSQRQFRDRYEPQDLKNLICLAKCKHPQGHFNCKQYDLNRQELYNESIVPYQFEKQSSFRKKNSHANSRNKSQKHCQRHNNNHNTSHNHSRSGYNQHKNYDHINNAYNQVRCDYVQEEYRQYSHHRNNNNQNSYLHGRNGRFNQYHQNRQKSSKKSNSRFVDLADRYDRYYPPF